MRTRTFAHVLGVDNPVDGAHVVMTFRAAGEELEALRHAGPPFRILGWGRDAMGLTLDDATDWDEVAELVVVICVLAPREAGPRSSTARTPPRPPVVIMPAGKHQPDMPRGGWPAGGDTGHDDDAPLNSSAASLRRQGSGQRIPRVAP